MSACPSKASPRRPRLLIAPVIDGAWALLLTLGLGLSILDTGPTMAAVGNCRIPVLAAPPGVVPLLTVTIDRSGSCRVTYQIPDAAPSLGAPAAPAFIDLTVRTSSAPTVREAPIRPSILRRRTWVARPVVHGRCFTFNGREYCE